MSKLFLEIKEILGEESEVEPLTVKVEVQNEDEVYKLLPELELLFQGKICKKFLHYCNSSDISPNYSMPCKAVEIIEDPKGEEPANL